MYIYYICQRVNVSLNISNGMYVYRHVKKRGNVVEDFSADTFGEVG